jgi:hypothetical protein
MHHFRILLLALGVACPAAAAAVPVEFDLPLADALLGQLVREQVYTDPDGTARVWDDGHACNSMRLSAPEVAAQAGLLRTRSRVAARIGTVVGNRCLALAEWNGHVEIFQEPVPGAAPGEVVFRVADSRLYAADGESRGVVGTLWDWVKQYAHPRFARLRIDLGSALDEVGRVLGSAVAATAAPPAIHVTGVTADRGRVNLRLRFEVDLPEMPAIPPGAEGPLTEEELARWEAAWQRWDAFVTTVVRRAGLDASMGDLRLDLLEVLLDARGDLQEVLTAAPSPGLDPLPALFLGTWERLAPLLRQLGGELASQNALRYLGFVAAGDALAAVESVAGTAGVRFDAETLRRLARMAAPEVADPLDYDLRVDADMRRLFGFGDPLPAPVATAGSPDALPVVPAGRPAMLTLWLPAAALQRDYAALVERINGWVPRISELDTYLPLVEQLLVHAAQETLRKKGLDATWRDMFHDIVLATAWQESCWRQFVKVKGEVRPIRSYAGSVGIMQVNFRVWRGFYDVDALLGDAGYNAQAGAEILHHYLADYALRKGEHRVAGGADNLPRATYALYNGGPKHMRRYRSDRTSRALRAIDAAFWDKYERVRAGETLAVAECFTGG